MRERVSREDARDVFGGLGQDVLRAGDGGVVDQDGRGAQLWMEEKTNKRICSGKDSKHAPNARRSFH